MKERIIKSELALNFLKAEHMVEQAIGLLEVNKKEALKLYGEAKSIYNEAAKLMETDGYPDSIEATIDITSSSLRNRVKGIEIIEKSLKTKKF